MTPTNPLTIAGGTAAEERLSRWRLVLGQGAAREGDGAGNEQGQEQAPQQTLSPAEQGMDEALQALYGDSSGGDLSKSMPDIARWLGDVRRYFPESMARELEQEAIRRLGTRRLVQHPELLAQVEPSAELAATLLSLRKTMPAETQATAREVVERLVREVMARLDQPLRQAIEGRIDRAARARRPRRPQDVNWGRTIYANLRHYQPAQGTIVPERLVAYGRRRTALREVVLCVDTSGSMGSSVVHSSIAAAVMASIPSIRTRLVMFDTAVVDLSEDLSDPVGLLFGLRLGGGTNIDRALAYCQQIITRPRDTVLVLITDLFEGGDKEQLIRRVATLQDDGVRLITLLALNDKGAPRYNQAIAEQLAGLGVAAFACTPDRFPEVIGRALGG